MVRERNLDRFEQEQEEFFERVRSAYLERAHAEPERFVIIDSSQPKEQVSELVCDAINAKLDTHLQQS